MGTLQR